MLTDLYSNYPHYGVTNNAVYRLLFWITAIMGYLIIDFSTGFFDKLYFYNRCGTNRIKWTNETKFFKESSVSFILHLQIPTYSSTNRQVADAQRRCIESRPLARTFAFSTFYFFNCGKTTPLVAPSAGLYALIWGLIISIKLILFILSAGITALSIINGYVFGFVREKVVSRTNQFAFISCQ